MKTWTRYFVSAIAAAGAIFTTAAILRAETCTLEIKRLESQTSYSRSDYIYRATQAQYFNAQVGPEGKNRVRFGGQEEQTAAFKKIVTKEPTYESDYPLRGVAKFGTQQYAFALDESIPESEKKAKAEEEEKEAKSKADAEKKKENQAKSDSAISKLTSNLLQALSLSDQNEPSQPEMPQKAVNFNRLYFDANHNGDLTDDKVIEAEQMPNRGLPPTYRQFQFPRVDVTIDADGTSVDYAFFLRGTVNAQRDFSYAGVQINSAAYREGDITLDGKKRHVVLIDFNSNGRFDDQFKISKEIVRSGGRLYPEQGDMLLVDPNQASTGYVSPYNPTSNTYQHYVSKMVDIDGKYYDLKITPAGDELTLTPSSLPLGNVTNPNDHFSAVVYGDNGFLKISGNKDTPIALPAGQWKLLSYTIDLTNAPEPSKPEEKKEDSKKSSGLLALGQMLESLLGSATPTAPLGRRFSYVTAQATAKYKPIEVREGETVELPFGPPYKPLVTIDYIQGQGGDKAKQAQMGMTLTGSMGEVVSDMMVGGGRPSKPEFTIKDPKGEVVQNGSFEYG